MFGTIMFLLAAPPAAAPPPVATGPGVTLGARPAEVQDTEIAAMLIADAQLTLNVNKALHAHDVVTELFARLGPDAACRAYGKALRTAADAGRDEWRRVFVAAARDAIPFDVLEAARTAGAGRDDLFDPHRPALVARLAATAQLVAQRVFVAAGTELSVLVNAAPEPDAATRERNLAPLAGLRAKPMSFCVSLFD